jgi:hypothetical protein
MKDYCDKIYLNIPNQVLITILKDAAAECLISDPLYKAIFNNETLADVVEITVIKD